MILQLFIESRGITPRLTGDLLSRKTKEALVRRPVEPVVGRRRRGQLFVRLRFPRLRQLRCDNLLHSVELNVIVPNRLKQNTPIHPDDVATRDAPVPQKPICFPPGVGRDREGELVFVSEGGNFLFRLLAGGLLISVTVSNLWLYNKIGY